MKSISKSCCFSFICLLIQFFNCLGFPVIEGQLKNVSDVVVNKPNVQSFHGFSKGYCIPIQEKIDLCKNKYADFDYTQLNEEDKNQLSVVVNPCRVDCVVYEPMYSNIPGKRYSHKSIYTVYFKDGKTICSSNGKVCKPIRDFGMCLSV